MKPIPLKKLLKKRELTDLIDSLLGFGDSPMAVVDVEGQPLLGELPFTETVDRYPIQSSQGCCGWVCGNGFARSIAAVLSRLAEQENEKRLLSANMLETYKEITLLYNMAENLAAALELESVAQIVLDHAAKVIDFDSGSLMLLNPGSSRFEILMAAGDEQNPKTALSPAQGIAGSVFSSRRPEIINDVQSDQRFEKGDTRLKALICTPLMTKNKVHGVMNLSRNTPEPFVARDLKLSNTLAFLAAVAIENAMLFTHLKISEEKYRSLFEDAIEGIFQISPKGRFISANPAMAAIMSCTLPSELTSASRSAKISGAARTFIRNVVEMLREHHQVTGMEACFPRPDGSHFWGAVSASAIHDEDGQLLRYEGSVLDITDRKEKEKAQIEKEIAEAANRKITDSISYAKLIQRAMLPDIEEVNQHIPRNFIIWQPRDIVGGDIFFFDITPSQYVVAVIDCTGHGVPGAFMTMIASTGMRSILKDEKCRDPGLILKRLNFIVKKSMHQDKTYTQSDDGLEAAVCRVKPQEGILTFAGARLPLFYVHDQQAHMIKGDKQGVGYKRSDLDHDFTTTDLRIRENMALYLATDGYLTQLGQKERRMFGRKRFMDLLTACSHEPFDTQKAILTDAFESFRGDNELQDDVTVIGIGL